MPVGGPNPNAWHNWYHCVGSTYGSWLRGDPRGFRTFRHREHVDGDYRNPPPTVVWEPVFEERRAKLPYPPVVLSPAQRHCICGAMVEKLQADDVEVVVLAGGLEPFPPAGTIPVVGARGGRSSQTRHAA